MLEIFGYSFVGLVAAGVIYVFLKILGNTINGIAKNDD